MVIYHPFIDYDISGNYSQKSMLYFLKDNIFLIYKEHKENIPSNYVRIFGDLQKFSQYSIELNYIWHPMSAPPLSFGGIFYTTKTRKYSQNLC